VEGDLVLLLGELPPAIAASRLASVIGSRSMRTSSRCTGTVVVTFSVTMYLRSRALPDSRLVVPTESSSSERVIASSVSGPLTSRPTLSFSRPESWRPSGNPVSERDSP
jgi:hypothetical protein